MRNLPVIIGLGAALLIGLSLFSLGARNFWRGIASYRWPTTSATVVQSSVDSEATPSSTSKWDSDSDSSAIMYMAQLRFQYQVNGRDYQTDQIYIGQTAGSADSSEAELRRLRYPLGTAVRVSYNPSNPSVASVHPGLQSEVLWLPGAGLAFLVPTLLAYLVLRSFGSSSVFTVVGTIFCLVFIAVGSIFLFFGGRSLWRGWRSAQWPTAKGVIVYGQRDESKSRVTTADHEEYTATSTGQHIIYRFEVNGQTHFSNNRRFGQLAAADAEWASRIARMYPLGREVTVSYNPANPDLATIEPGVTSEALWGPGAGVAFILFALAVLFIGLPMLGQSPF